MSRGLGQGAERPRSTAGGDPAGQRSSSTLAVSSVSLGLFTLLGCSWIPVVNVGALLLAPLAVILGYVGIRRRGSVNHVILSWLGVATGSLAVIVSIAMLIAFMTMRTG